MGLKLEALIYFATQALGRDSLARIPGVGKILETKFNSVSAQVNKAFFDELFDGCEIETFADLQPYLDPKNYLQMIVERKLPVLTPVPEQVREDGLPLGDRPMFIEAGTGRVVLRFADSDQK